MSSLTKSGFVGIIGKPNAGKSTLMNKILGEKISIVTKKPQTTRKRVLGIYSNDNVQIIFLDNPGLLKPKYALHQSMMQYVIDSIDESDIIIFMIDAKEYLQQKDNIFENYLKNFQQITKPKILLLNKIDLLSDVRLTLPLIKEFAEINLFDEIIPISALKQSDMDSLINLIVKYLPECPFYYDPEMLSTLNERFFVSEIIRESIFNLFGEEIPYSTEVSITEFKEREKGKWFISADIIVEKNSQKGIIIGDKGRKIKQIGENARKKIEKHLNMPAYIDLYVKVKERWRNDKRILKDMGY